MASPIGLDPPARCGATQVVDTADPSNRAPSHALARPTPRRREPLFPARPASSRPPESPLAATLRTQHRRACNVTHVNGHSPVRDPRSDRIPSTSPLCDRTKTPFLFALPRRKICVAVDFRAFHNRQREFILYVDTQLTSGGSPVGEIRRKDSAVEDIVSDATTTRTNAKVRGGRWHELAELRLASVLTLFANIETQREAAEQAHAPHAAAIDVRNEKADKTIGKVYDVIWNEIGRPGWDAALSVIFPDGIAYYADGDTNEQPTRMDILVKLLQSGIHPKLSQATADICADEIATEAAALNTAVSNGRPTGATVKVLGRVRTALGKVVHSELASLKRLYKAEGFSETEIHTVIPDRPTKSSKKNPNDD